MWHDDEKKFGFLAKLPRERGLHHCFSAALSISIQAAMTLLIAGWFCLKNNPAVVYRNKQALRQPVLESARFSIRSIEGLHHL